MSDHGDGNWITVANTFKNYHYYIVRYYSKYTIGFMPWYNIGGYSMYKGWFYGMFSNANYNDIGGFSPWTIQDSIFSNWNGVWFGNDNCQNYCWADVLMRPRCRESCQTCSS